MCCIDLPPLMTNMTRHTYSYYEWLKNFRISLDDSYALLSIDVESIPPDKNKQLYVRDCLIFTAS